MSAIQALHRFTGPALMSHFNSPGMVEPFDRVVNTKLIVHIVISAPPYTCICLSEVKDVSAPPYSCICLSEVKHVRVKSLVHNIETMKPNFQMGEGALFFYLKTYLYQAAIETPATRNLNSYSKAPRDRSINVHLRTRS